MRASTYKKRIIEDMTAIGTYRPEFDEAIKTLSKIYENLDAAQKQFKNSGSQFLITTKNKSGNDSYIKNPLYRAIEDMSNQILIYSRELGLTPRGLKQIRAKGLEAEKKSKFEERLSGL